MDVALQHLQGCLGYRFHLHGISYHYNSAFIIEFESVRSQAHHHHQTYYYYLVMSHTIIQLNDFEYKVTTKISILTRKNRQKNSKIRQFYIPCTIYIHA